MNKKPNIAVLFPCYNEEATIGQVVNKEGKRAIGTYISVTHPDGSSDPVVANEIKGLAKQTA